MADWNKPTLTDTYANFLTYMKALVTDAAQLFNSSPTNPIANMIKLVRSPVKLQEYSGGSWVDRLISIEGGGTNASTASGARTNLGLGSSDTPTFSGIFLDTTGDILVNSSDGSDNGYIQIGHASNSRGAFSIIYGNEHANAGQHVIASGNVTNGNINISPGGTTTFKFLQSGGHFEPATDDSYDIGSSSKRVRNIYLPKRTHSPTLFGNGSMSISSQTIRESNYCRIGDYLFFEYVVTYTIGGTPNSEIKIPAPIAGSAMSIYAAHGCGQVIDGDGTRVTAFWNFDGTDIKVFKAGGANWVAGSNGLLSIEGQIRL